MLHVKPLIALVDDDLPFVDLMTELLEDEGYDTACCLEGAQAHKIIKEKLPELVILDLWIQEPTQGFMVLDLMRRDPVTAHIPVIFTSASTQLLRDNAAQLHSQNCDILEKPFDLDQLLAKVRARVGSSPQYLATSALLAAS